MPSVSASWGRTRHPCPYGRHVPAGGVVSTVEAGRHRMIDRLGGGERAHAVDERPARPDERGGAASADRRLERGEIVDRARRDPPPGVGAPAQRTEPGARRVEQHPVEAAVGERRSGAVGDTRRPRRHRRGSMLSRMSPTASRRHVGGHHERTGGDRPRRHRGRLAAGSGTHVEHPLPRSSSHRGGDPLRRAILDVAVVADATPAAPRSSGRARRRASSPSSACRRSTIQSG